jgi:putative copper export protein
LFSSIEVFDQNQTRVDKKDGQLANTPSDLANLFFRLIKTEAVLGIAILLITACLTQLPPPPQLK